MGVKYNGNDSKMGEINIMGLNYNGSDLLSKHDLSYYNQHRLYTIV